MLWTGMVLLADHRVYKRHSSCRNKDPQLIHFRHFCRKWSDPRLCCISWSLNLPGRQRSSIIKLNHSNIWIPVIRPLKSWLLWNLHSCSGAACSSFSVQQQARDPFSESQPSGFCLGTDGPFSFCMRLITLHQTSTKQCNDDLSSVTDPSFSIPIGVWCKSGTAQRSVTYHYDTHVNTHRADANS